MRSRLSDHVPKLEHGTHVAGLLGGDWRQRDTAVSMRPHPAAEKQPADPPIDPPAEGFAGVCPDINLYDLRILNEEGIGDEFTVMAALQFVRYLNSHQDYPTINGVNLSLSIPHEVANYACGRTPGVRRVRTRRRRRDDRGRRRRRERRISSIHDQSKAKGATRDIRR